MTHIVKRRGHTQAFDERKLYASIYAACLSSHLEKQEAESIASRVTSEVKKWIATQDAVSSDAIFEKTGEELKNLNKQVALMYSTHRDVS